MLTITTPQPSCIFLIPIPSYNISKINPRAQNLRQGIVMKTSFKTRVLRMGLGSFVEISIFVMKYFLFSFFIFSILSNLLNQNLHKVKTPKRKLESFVQQYSFKFRAQGYTTVRYTELPSVPKNEKTEY